MVTASSFIPVLKYGFLTLVVSCAGYLIASVTVFKHIDGESMADLLVWHHMAMKEDGAAGVLDKGFERCLIHPSNVFCLMSDHKHLEQNFSQEFIKNLTMPRRESRPKVHPVFQVLRAVTKLSRNFTVQPVLVDPSILFCILNPISKAILLKHGFNPARFRGPENSVMIGFDENDARVLNESFRLIPYFSHWSKSSLPFNPVLSPPRMEPTPIQFTFRYAATAYAGVFHRRNGYLWRSFITDVNDSLLINNTVFENFTAVRIPNSLDLDLYIPSDPVHFLHQMESSSFLWCHQNVSESLPHPTLTREELENRAVVAIQELKTVFYPYMVRFWIWGESRAGWVSGCNVFEKVTDFNIAALNSDLEKLNLTEVFSDNEFLTLVPEFIFVDNKISKIFLDCHGLKINLFVAHEEGESLGFYEDVDGNMEWLTYYKSQMMSTDVFGQIVYVPEESIISSNQELLH